jgi:ATP-dependent DNA ligase
MLVAAPIKARFVEPMLLQRTDSLPDGTDFAYEVKLDGYRGIQASPEHWEHCPTKR